MSDSIKRFITCHIPVFICNFKCHYCYISQLKVDHSQGIKPFYANPKQIANDLSVERLGGICYFNLCADGETLMHPDIVNLVYSLTKAGHYSDIITNGILTEKLLDIIKQLNDEQKSRLFIKFSFHWLELQRLNLMQKFVDNVNIIKNAKISYSIEITPSDELIPYIDEIKSFSLKEFGALPHITVARNEATEDIELLSKYSKEDYKKIWQVFDSPLFNFKISLFNERRKEFCYAGVQSLEINLKTGDYYQCYRGDKLGNLIDYKKPIKFRAIGKCRLPHCFNGHAFLAFGNIRELNTPTYADERNRECINGDNWLQPQVMNFFQTKTSDFDKDFSFAKKALIYIHNFSRKILMKIKPRIRRKK